MHAEIIWIKENFQFGRADYHWQHEPCLYGWRKSHTFLGERNQSTVWQIHRETDHQHPTTKPVALWRVPIRNHLKPGEIVLDLFLGSGTAIIAAEQGDVRGFGMELSAGYCDVVVRRWAGLMGKDPVLEETGETFTAAAATRGVEVSQ